MKNKNWFSACRVHPSVVAIVEFNHFEKVVSYLIVSEGETLLIDTGMGFASISEFVKKSLGLEVNRAVLTHAHWDHAGGVGEFEEVCVFDDDWEVSQLKRGFLSKEIEELVKLGNFEGGFVPREYRVEGRDKVGRLKDGDEMRVGELELMVVHTPGHTPGGICLWEPSEKLLFTGDVVYPGPLYAQLPESDVGDYATSVKRLVEMCDEEVLVLPGHNTFVSDYDLLVDIADGFDRLLGDESLWEKGGEYVIDEKKRLSILFNADSMKWMYNLEHGQESG